jgi:hypothetical protein
MKAEERAALWEMAAKGLPVVEFPLKMDTLWIERRKSFGLHRLFQPPYKARVLE